MKKFLEFVDKKERDAIKQLQVLMQVLQKFNWEVEDFTENIDDPYIFVKAPTKEELSFEGIRIYKIGKSLAYRIQNEAATHPYGKAYALDVESMYTDLVSDDMDEQRAGQEVMNAINSEIKRFFKESLKAEKEMGSSEIEKDKDALGNVVIKSTGTDYSNQVTSKIR
jgi:hypothetical protein